MKHTPLLWFSSAFLCGIFLGQSTGWNETAWLWIAALFGALFALQWLPLRKRLWGKIARSLPAWLEFKQLEACAPYLLLLSVAACGAARFQAFQPVINSAFIAWYNDRQGAYILEGVIVAPPDQRDGYTNLRVQVSSLRPADQWLDETVGGLLMARVPPGSQWRYGDRVWLRGYLETPFESETFSYRDYLARQGIHSVLTCGTCLDCSAVAQETCIRLLERDLGNPLLSFIYRVRERGLQLVYRYLPDPESSLLAGIFLGVESGILPDVQRAFQDTGTSHIIAISGFNFTIVAGLFATLFSRLFGRWRGALAALISIAIYTVLVGAGAGVVRAALMSGSSLIAHQLGRRQHGLNSLGFTAALMAWLDPWVLWDVSFQLSFTATLGLILYAEPLGAAFVHYLVDELKLAPLGLAKRLSGPVGEYFLFTLAAQVTTLPVIIYHFQRLPLVSLLANPLILPAQPPVMILGGLAVLLGILFEPLGQAVAYLLWPFLAYTTRLVGALASWNAGMLVLGKTSLGIVVAFYLVLLGWTFGGQYLRTWLAGAAGDSALSGWKLLLSKLVIPGIIGAALLTIVVWQAAFNRPDGRLHLTVFDVGSGDALLLQTPSGRRVLIDGGPSPNRLSDSLGRRLPVLARQVDFLVVAATTEEQLAGLPETIERFPPDQVLWSGSPLGSYSARRLQEKLGQYHIPIHTAATGQTLELGDGARLHLLAVDSHGAVLLVEWGNFRVLLPVGLGFESLEALQSAPQAPVTALLLAHSGYAPLNPAEWIAHWQPQIILLSVAAGDREGRPQPETLQAIQNYPVLRTDQLGWVRLSTDGNQLWVETQNNSQFQTR